MPMAYFQCPKCLTPHRTDYKVGRRKKPSMTCFCRAKDRLHPKPHEGTKMTYRGDGWDGRFKWPHGNPYENGVIVKEGTGMFETERNTRLDENQVLLPEFDNPHENI